MNLEEFSKLSSQEKMLRLKEELYDAFPANSMSYDLNEIIAKYPGYEVLVWNAAMLLVEEVKLGLIQVKAGCQVRWLMMRYPNFYPISNDEFKSPLKKMLAKGNQNDKR